MIVGCPKEIKAQEHRVGLVPGSVKEFVARGHKVLIETGAGAGINFSDDDYIGAGAEIRKTAKEIFDQSDMIIKVKEPQAAECRMLREGQILFTYLHLAADAAQAKGLMDSKCVAIAYETGCQPNHLRRNQNCRYRENAGRTRGISDALKKNLNEKFSFLDLNFL